MIERTIDCAVNLPISCKEILPTTRLRLLAAFGEQIQMDSQNLLMPCPEYNKTKPAARSRCDREELRHILLGSPSAIQQTIHQLHVLNYAESVLWSPIVSVRERIVITSDQGKAMSLLRR